MKSDQLFSQFKVKYTSTYEVMQPPKEIIFYDETLETIAMRNLIHQVVKSYQF